MIDTASEKVIATIPVGKRPIRPVLNPSGTKVYVPNYEGNSVSVVSTSTLKVLRTIKVGRGPIPPVFNASGTRMWVGNEFSGTVSEIDTTAPRTKNPVLRTIAVGKQPTFAMLNAEGDTLYVTNLGSGTISGICTRTGKIGRILTTSSQPRQTVGGPALYSIDQGGRAVSVFPASLAGAGVCS
ncbi:MAG: YncE family protein [Solirubrobacterales bacterium]